MEPSSTWGSNGLANCDGVWGSSGSTITGGSIWGSGGSTKRTSEVWSGLDIDSKLEGSSRWGSLTSDGSSYRPRNGSPSSNVGVLAAPDSDADPWGRSSGHGSSSSWGSASTSDNKDISGWGSLDPSPVPNAGTESWGFRSGASDSQAENKLSDWKLSGDVKPSLGTEKDLSSNSLHPENQAGEVKPSDVQSVWNRCASVSDSSRDTGNAETAQAESAGKLPSQNATVPVTSSISSGAGRNEDALAKEPCLIGDVLSHEEIIRRAVNSHEGWGKTPIRQDTAWNIDDEPKKPFLPAKPEDISADRNQRAIRDQTNSLSWSQPSELPSAMDKGRTGSGAWGNTASDNLAIGGIMSEAVGSDAGTELGGKTIHPSDKLMLEANWSLRSPGTKDIEWGANLGLAQNSWDSSDAARMNRVSVAEPGGRGPTLSRSSSASTWSSEETDWPKGDLKDKVSSIWSNDSTDSQNWKSGFKPTTPLPTENLFNVPPPQFGSNNFESMANVLGNPAKQGINIGGPPDSGKPPQMRIRLLQQLMDMGFKREDAQAALISNNLNMDDTISKLLANKMRDSDADLLGARRQFQGANPVDIAALSRTDLPPEVAACLVGLMQNPSNSMPSMGQLGLHLGSAGGAAQLRSSGAGSVPPFPSNPLGMLSPNMLPALQQKLLQTGLRNDGNQTALQHQLLQQHLLQNIQSAIQANLIPPQLINAQSLTPTVLVKVQQMMEMYQALQGLIARYQLLVQENLALLQSRQRPQNLGEIELIMTTFKQQICATQQQILQELMVLQPPPPPSAASGIDQLLKNFAGLQTKDETLLAAGLMMNPWKVGSSGDDPSGLLDQTATSNPSLLQHSISMTGSKADAFGMDRPLMLQSSTSCWSRPSDLGITGATGRNEDSIVSVSAAFVSNSAAGGAMSSITDSGNSSRIGSEDGETSGQQLEIAEFIPGKPWQGLSSKSVEDDPGSTTPASLVLNSDVQSTFGRLGREYSPSSSGVHRSGSDPAPGGSSGFSGMSKSSISNANLSQKVSLWSPVDPSMTSDLWGKSQGVPPGIPYQNNRMPFQQQQQQSALNRSNLWPNSEQTSFKPLQSISPNLPSNWLRLKNVSPQVDMRVLEALCEQHGHLECFVPNLTRDSVIIKYVKLDDACKAQKLLNLCPRMGQPLVAEFLNKFEVFQILQQTPPASIQSQISKPYAGATSPFQMPGLGKSGPNPSRWNMGSAGAQFNAGAALGSTGGTANPWGGEEHGLYLPNSKQF